MIPMGLNTDDLTFLVGDPERLRQMSGTPALPAFSERAVTFLSSLSRLLLRDKRSSVDVKSYAYWIRRASLEAAAREGDFQNRLGRGVALHIAPSDVPGRGVHDLLPAGGKLYGGPGIRQALPPGGPDL